MIISSGLTHRDMADTLHTASDGHEYSSEAVAREAELIRQSDYRFAVRFATGEVGYTELCREAGMPHRQIKACREAIGPAVERDAVIEALSRSMPSDIIHGGKLGVYADAYLREIAADAGLVLQAAAE